MDLWRSLSGMVEVELTSADPAGALHAINLAGIELFHARHTGDLTLCFGLQRCDYKKLRILSDKRGERLKLSHKSGLYWAVRQLLRRPVLLLGIALITFLTVYLPAHIYFVEVEGNLTVPTNLILEMADQCGISFGADRREVRSEKMKNALLQAIPELQWAGINTYGCRAVISVREKPVSDEPSEGKGISSIVAARDGVIREITVRSGNRVCSVGQAVKQGQVLISGYTDCGICIRATRAEGEIFAETRRSLTALLPVNYEQKVEIISQETKYSLLIGKKQINFCKDSGISTTTCDKMYSVNYITLPGGFRLPIALVTETRTYYETAPTTMDDQTAEDLITRFSGKYLAGTMTAGQIEQRFETVELCDGLCRLRGQYVCVEMIGKTRLEENLEHYGKTD